MESPIELLNLQEMQEDRVLTFEPTSFDNYLGQGEIKSKLKKL